MTPLEYVRNRLAKDYSDRANDITGLLDKRMAELNHPAGITEEEMQGDFQKLLTEALYPFIACIRALRDAGLAPEEADRYARTIWDEMPVEMKREIVQKNMEI